jgi:hypothetical protein
VTVTGAGATHGSFNKFLAPGIPAEGEERALFAKRSLPPRVKTEITKRTLTTNELFRLLCSTHSAEAGGGGFVLQKTPFVRFFAGQDASLPPIPAPGSALRSHPCVAVSEYFRENFFITTSGYFTGPPFRCAMEIVGEERLLYSVDYRIVQIKAGPHSSKGSRLLLTFGKK